MAELNLYDSTIKVISDWKHKSETKQKLYLSFTIAVLIVAFVASFFTFTWFQRDNYKRIVNNNMNYIQDSAVQEATQIEREMEITKTLAIKLANQYAFMEKSHKYNTIEDKMKVLEDSSIFDRIAFIDRKGNDTSLQGITNVEDRAYFQNALAGKSGWEAISESRVTHKPTVAFYAPIYIDNEVIGAMVGFYEQQKLDELFSYKFFNYKPISYLMLGDGTVIASSDGSRISKNILKILSEQEFLGEVDIKEIRKMINDDTRTTVTFSYKEERKSKVGTIVQFNNSDWMILSVLPGDVTSDMVEMANKTGKVMLSSILIIFIVVLLMMLFFFKKQRRHLEDSLKLALENLKMNINNERRQLFIINSIGDIYNSIYFIDMITGKHLRIKELDKDVLIIPSEGNAAENLKTYIDNFVDEKYQDEMREFLDYDTLSERLSLTTAISMEYTRKDGGWKRGTIAASERDENGKVCSVVYGVQNIDEEKNTEAKAHDALKEAYRAAQLASDAKTTFLSNMSHDIRTPMNAIIGMTAIAGVNIDDKQKVMDCLKKINTSGKHLLSLINEVLDMSKIESGKVDLVDDCFSIPELLDELISVHQPLVEEKNHSLAVRVENVKHDNVIGDGTRLMQVFTNLLSNAIKYTPNNGNIEICLKEIDSNKPGICLYEFSVKDDGIGMSEEFLDRLFEPFARADDSRVSNTQGTGLGMPIVKNIIRMMNGEINVESKINEGSKFTVSFILKAQRDEEESYEKFVDLPVLVVDDDKIACESTCLILDGLAMNSEYVTSGKEAIEKTKERHKRNENYYAVIVDWKMPDMDGVETTRAIRKEVGDDVPIIIFSAYDWSDIEKEARDAGANAFLSKPLFKSRVVNLFYGLLYNEEKYENIISDNGSQNVDFGEKRILLVEDNMLNLEIAIEFMTMLGVEIETAENGRLGYEKFVNSEDGYYDMIFMDIQMPEMNGYEATKAIRESSHPDAKIIPIIATTANAFASDVKDALDAGMNDHIAKPLEINRIVSVLEQYFTNEK